MPAQDSSVSVTYAACRALTTTHTGSGGDPVPAPANSLNCPSGMYVGGQTIALIGKPTANQRIESWTGTDTTPDTGALVNTLTMPYSVHTVNAAYETCYLLSAQISGQGDPLTAIPAASTGCAAGRYVGGQSITLSSAPASGWTVQCWNGTSDDGCTMLDNSLVMPSGDHVVGVTYAEQEEPDVTDTLYLPALHQ